MCNNEILKLKCMWITFSETKKDCIHRFNRNKIEWLISMYFKYIVIIEIKFSLI